MLHLLHASFYSSELKAVSQVVASVQTVGSTGELPGDSDRSRQRYRNTLTNLGLLEEAEDTLTPIGEQVVSYAQGLGLDPKDLTFAEHEEEVRHIERMIFDGLLATLLEDASAESKAANYFRDVIYALQTLLDSIPTEEVEGTLADLDKTLFLQMIHSSGFEVGRFHRLSEADQRKAMEIWETIVGSCPSTEPDDPVDKAIHVYASPLAKKRVQKDIRFRVAAAARAYLDARQQLGHMFPKLSAERRVKFHSGAATRRTQFLLGPREKTHNLDLPRQWIVCGCPGSGKSHFVTEQLKVEPAPHVIRVTFHPETTYFDFVGCYKPAPVYEQVDATLLDSAGRPAPRGRPVIDYRFIHGPFVESYLKAELNPNWSVILIIEEMNRANCAAVFGDMFQLLDRNADGESNYSIEAPPDLADYLVAVHGDSQARRMVLPKNLFLWATMNSADEGVLPLDSAFRRRWEFLYMGHATKCAYPEGQRAILYAGEARDWDNFRKLINTKLATLDIHEDKLIGPYFLTPAELKSPAKVLNKLFLYLWEDVLRFQQRHLMDFDSFSDLVDAWKDGQGDPLGLYPEPAE